MSLALTLVAGGALSGIGCDRDTLIGIDVPPFGTGGLNGSGSGGTFGAGSGGTFGAGSGGTFGHSTGGTFGAGSGGTFGAGSGGTFGAGSGGTFGAGSGGTFGPGSGGTFGSGSGGTVSIGSGGSGAFPGNSCSSIATQSGALNGCGYTNDVAFSPDGALLAVSTKNFPQSNLHVWRVSDGSLAYQVGRAANQNGTYGVAFSPDGKLLALGGFAPIVSGAGNAAAVILDAATGSLLEVLPTQSGSYVSAVAFSHDGARLVTAGASSFIDVWNVANWSEALLIPTADPESVYAVDFSPDDSRFITATSSGTARIRKTTDGTEVARISGLYDEQNRATYSPNGQLILSIGAPGQLQILDPTGASLQVMTFNPGPAFEPIGYAVWIDDNRFVADDHAGTVEEWTKDPAQPQGPFSLKATWLMPGPALGLAVAPDHRSFVVAGAFGFEFLAP